MPETMGAGTIQFFRERQRIETPLTVGVLTPLPEEKLSCRPHPASQTAGTAAWTIGKLFARL